MKKTTFIDINFSSFVFKENQFLTKEGDNSEKFVVVEEELDGIEIDGLENLEDLPGLVFIDAR